MSHPSPAARALRLGLAAALLIICAHSARAGGALSFVSSDGDDAHACTRSTPCRTFAGALPKTDPKGEVVVLDAGEYGCFTITASVSITATGVRAGVGAVGYHGIVIEPPAGSSVVLRGLTIWSPSTNFWAGILYAGPGPSREEPEDPLVSVHVEDCTINGYRSGISFRGKGALLVKDTTVRNASVHGLELGPSPSGAVRATVVNSRLERNGYGMYAVGPGVVEVTARDTVAANNQVAGFYAHDAGVRLQLHGCVAAHQPYGVRVLGEARAALVGCAINNSETGVAAAQYGLVQLSDTTVTNNQVGVDASGNGKVHTLGNNGVFDNALNTKAGPFFVLQPL